MMRLWLREDQYPASSYTCGHQMIQLEHTASSLLLWRPFSQTIILDCFSAFWNSLITPRRQPPTLYVHSWSLLVVGWPCVIIFEGGFVWNPPYKMTLRRCWSKVRGTFYNRITSDLFFLSINVILHLKLSLFKFKLLVSISQQVSKYYIQLEEHLLCWIYITLKGAHSFYFT